MVQALAETIFDICYLALVIALGAVMLVRSAPGSLTRRFGLMAVVLGGGDAFHLVPRVMALWTTGLAANAAALGIGKLVTSITMMVFYLILYAVWRMHFGVKGRTDLTACLWALAALRIALCLLPQNDWLSADAPLSFGILRNIPFAIMGAILIALFWQATKGRAADPFRHMPAAILLSFGFYLPVVLFADAVPAIGMLMIPKTLAYVWMIWMGWRVFRANSIQNKPTNGG